MFNWRPKREIPQVDYNEDSSSEGEEFVSPLRPSATRAGTPDSTDELPVVEEVLQGAKKVLIDEEELETIEVLTKEFRGGSPDNFEVENMPDDEVVVNFEDEDGENDQNAMQEACRNLQRLEFEENDLDFWFNQVEIKMSAVGVKKNYTKFQVLTTIIPKKVINQCKPLLRKQASDFPNKDAYKQLKATILRIFGPRPEARMERALSRTLTGRPSDLARDLVNDICLSDLEGCKCCPAIILAMWKRHLPGSVRAGIAHCNFTKETFDTVVQLADDIFVSNAPASSMAAIATPSPSLNETQPAMPYPIPEVSAVNRGGSNRSRGRGNRGRGGGGRGSSSQQQQQRNKGAKHPDLPAGEWSGCSMHFKWGRSAHFCSEPASCPWKDIFTAKPRKN